MTATSDKKRICVGAFAGAHGVHGHAKVKTFTSEPEDVAHYGQVESEDGHRQFTLKIIRPLKPKLLLISAPEIENREDAATLAGTRLYVSREKLIPSQEDDEFYHADLIGLVVHTSDGTVMGEVSAVHNFGAGDIIEITNIPNHKGNHLVPFSKEAVPEISLENGYIVLHTEYVPDTK